MGKPLSNSFRATVAMPHIRVVVTQEIIDNAIRKNSGKCIISDALKLAMPDFYNPQTDMQTIRVTDPVKKLRFIYLTPRPALHAIIKFDEGTAIEPFSFTLRVPAQIVTSGRKRRKGQSSGAEQEKDTGRRRQRRADYALGRAAHAYDGSKEHKTPREVARRVLEAMDNPELSLGPAVAIPAQGRNGLPVIVGGQAPPLGNLATTRKYGLRILRG